MMMMMMITDDDDVEVEEEVRDEEDWGEVGGLRRTEEEVEDGKNDETNDSWSGTTEIST